MSKITKETNFAVPSSSARKPARKPIVVRQTLTSKLRAERGDKLQFIKNQLEALTEKLNCSSKESLCSEFKKPNNDFKTPSQKNHNVRLTSASENRVIKKTITSTTTNRPVSSAAKPNIKATKTVSTLLVSNSQSMKKPPACRTLLNKTTPHEKFNNRLTLMPNQIKTNLSTKSNSLLPNQIKSTLPKLDDKPRRQTFMPQPKPKKTALKKKENTNPNAVKKTVTMQSPMRKSLTAMHLKRVSNCNRNSVIKRTMSWSDGLCPHEEEGPVYRSPAKQEHISFRTPSMAQRRSVAFQTPMTAEKKTMTPYSIISTPTTSALKRRLGLWLEKKGKPLDSFHHLRCFGVDSTAEIDEENKENFEVFIPEKNSSYEDLKITPKKALFKDRNISVANDAMYDLHKLILDRYPREQCEAWLDLISSRFQEVQDRPQYWECRAALEEARGNYQSALDCYSNAIVKGAEIEKVNDPLDNLLEKFSVLNISQSETVKPSEQIKIIDARNIFKSSIISFAIQERSKSVGEDGCRFSATPVRRSTRKSRLHYVTRPDVTLYSTLDNIDSSVRKSLSFQNNRGFEH